MFNNMNFYKFMHRQILILIALFAGTSLSYPILGYVYGSFTVEIIWYGLVILVSLWGYYLHRIFSESLTVKEKESWLVQLRYFIFFYFSTWTIMFIYYVSQENIELHYLAIFTQLGVAVVATTILVSEKKLAVAILSSSMFPITVYLVLVGEFYSYVIAFLTVVFSWVLLYGSRNTYNYLRKSQFQAYNDYLTKLGNRRFFIEELEDAIKIQKQKHNYMFLLLIDLDHFKTINDTLGHDIGDMLLIEAAQRMKKLSEENLCSVSRLGGDEFCILSSSCKSKEECISKAIEFAEEMLDTIKETYIIEEHNLYISASIGVSIIDSPQISANVFIKEADIAMYEAKLNGRDGVIVFDDELSKRVERRLEIERLLHFATENHEIKLVYQPQFNNKDEVVGCEVLSRWTNEKLGNVTPDEFIPISEDTGTIVDLGLYILEESFKTFLEWKKKGIILEQYSINISMRQFYHTNFVPDVKSLCDKYLDNEIRTKLMFEITETSIAGDINTLINKMNKLIDCGIRFSMDDFGTGYSSLSYLRQIPIYELKIDKSFIQELDEENKEQSIVKTILNIANNLDLNIVAEGVETKVQKEFLIKENCDIFQGYYYSKPIDKEEFELFVSK